MLEAVKKNGLDNRSVKKEPKTSCTADSGKLL